MVLWRVTNESSEAIQILVQARNPSIYGKASVKLWLVLFSFRFFFHESENQPSHYQKKGYKFIKPYRIRNYEINLRATTKPEKP